MLSPRRVLGEILGKIHRLWQLVLDATRELILRTVLTVLLFVGYVVLAMILYAVMRQILVPQKTHYLPVHLYFSPHCHGDNVVPVMAHEQQTQDQLPRCTYPYAEFHLASGERLLSPGHTYSVTVKLDMPESPWNEQLGMFMINMTIFSYTRQQLTTSVRPAILHYKSFLLQTFSTIFYALPLILGFTEERQSQSIVMIERYNEPYTEGSNYAQVTILNHRVQVYNVMLVFDAEFTGLAYYLYHWPLTMSIIIVSAVFFSLSAVTIMMWLRNLMDAYHGRGRQRRHSQGQRMYLRAPNLAPIPEEEESDSGQGGGRGRRRLRAQEHHIEDVSTAPDSSTPTRTISETDSISSATEISTDMDIGELDHALQTLHDQVAPHDRDETTPLGHSTPTDDGLRHRPF